MKVNQTKNKEPSGVVQERWHHQCVTVPWHNLLLVAKSPFLDILIGCILHIVYILAFTTIYVVFDCSKTITLVVLSLVMMQYDHLDREFLLLYVYNVLQTSVDESKTNSMFNINLYASVPLIGYRNKRRKNNYDVSVKVCITSVHTP